LTAASNASTASVYVVPHARPVYVNDVAALVPTERPSRYMP
jgi:hypothetical protein